ncbi:MAG TPA: tetraacyldisaccharide 4'-kinase [Gemmatimonadaceae bacterium]|nr:tetraacyldisaccharide 4'-kinase [Gemmatimonadaceae bacterium]
MAERTLPEWLWWSPSAGARIARALLSPLSASFALVVRLRNAMFDRRMIPVRVPRLPALAVGNITVGGTGKPPVSSWLATQLQSRGARPAIVLRGYGDDEPLVHGRLTPSIPIVVNANRLEAIERAAASGADVAVLDDAFQHRSVARVADVVLVSADAPDVSERMLPTGPYREPFSALRRASLVIVTRKAVPLARAREVIVRVNLVAAGVRTAIVHLALDQVFVENSPPAPLDSLAGRRVLAIAGVGNGAAFGEQLAQAGATVRMRAFPDHHPFTAADAVSLARSVGTDEIALCTLKDAVKLLPLWPREAVAIGYVSQAVIVEERGDAIEAILDLAINARLRQL